MFRRKMVDILGGKCVRCDFADTRCLQIDHVNGDGFVERKLKRVNHEKLFRRLCESVAMKEHKYQLLCANCNWIKYFETDKEKVNENKRGFVKKEQIQLHLFVEKVA